MKTLKNTLLVLSTGNTHCIKPAASPNPVEMMLR
jgi:hypothetical protein